jgi:hypothetical protein
VAWRLRPLPPGTTAEFAAPIRPAAQVQTPPPASEPVPAAAGVEQTAAEAGASANASVSEPPPPPEAAPHRAAKSVAAPAARDDQVEVDVPAPAVVLDVPTPAAAPQPPQKTEASQGMADAAAGASADDALDRAVTLPPEPETGDEPLDAMPPATADAPGVRDAWLSRIRALIDSGDIAGGRHSLHAFVERYPDYPLPEDLRALQQ